MKNEVLPGIYFEESRVKQNFMYIYIYIYIYITILERYRGWKKACVFLAIARDKSKKNIHVNVIGWPKFFFKILKYFTSLSHTVS